MAIPMKTACSVYRKMMLDKQPALCFAISLYSLTK